MDEPAGAAAVPVFGLATAAALLVGTSAALLLPLVPHLALLLPVLAAGLALWWRGPRWRRSAGALLVGLAWTGVHAGTVLSAQLPPQLEQREWQVSGRVVGLPQPEGRRTRFQFRVDDDPSQPAALRGKRLQLSWYDDFEATTPGPRTGLQAGSRWRVQVKVRAPRGLANPGGFDSERYAMAQRIAATGYLRNPEAAERLSPAAGLDAWREQVSARIGSQVRSASSRYVRALALGDTHALDDRDWEILRAVGLTHLIAISGFHVGLVAGFAGLAGSVSWRCVPALARVLPRPQVAALAAMAGGVGYAAAAGFALPTVRTVLMIAVVALARASRRPVRVVDCLSWALLAVLVFDPLSLLAAGFWLSFGGVAWLMWCLPGPMAGRSLWREFLSAQGVATVGLLPMTAVLFGQASLAGPVANLVAIPWWSLVVVPLCLVGTGLEAVVPGSGAWAWRLGAWCFDLTWPSFESMAASRFALVWLPEGRWFALPLAMLGAFWLLLPRPVPGKALALLLWLPLLWPDRQLPEHGEVELLVLDVGQGLSVVVRTRRHVLLYDAGPAARDGFDAGERAVVPALRALAIGRLDRLVVSHGDNDHAGGVEAVRNVVPVGLALGPPDMPVPVDGQCLAGDPWTWDGVRFRFLHPPAHMPYFGNESSCVLRIEAAAGSALLTGDIGAVIEQSLVNRAPADLRADVVLAPHHGSAGSSIPAFVAATDPRLVLVASGFGNRFGHPRAEVVARWRGHGSELLDTAHSGAIRVWLAQAGLAVRERRVSQRRLWEAARVRRAATLSYRSDNKRPQAPED